MKISDFNLNKTDYPYIIIIMLFSVLTTMKMIEYHMSGGIFNHDKSLYLINALAFAGMDYHHISDPFDLFYSPFISLLTSILFRLGLVNKLAIFIVTGSFGIFGNLGLYILLKNKFNNILSLTGAIIFGSLTIILLNLASGLLDFPSVTISIWILVFTIVAVNKNPKYFIFLFPLWVLGFFTRYTEGFMLPLILLYYMLNREFITLFDDLISDRQSFKKRCLNYLKTDEFKYISLSIIIAAIIFILFCKILWDHGSTLFFVQQSIGTFHENVYHPEILDASDDKLYYIKNVVSVLFGEYRDFKSILTYLLCSIALGGFLLKLINVYRTRNDIANNEDLTYKTHWMEKILKISCILLFIGVILGFTIMTNHMVSNISLLVLFVILFPFIQKYSNKTDLSFDFLIVAWFLVYFIFLSMFFTKVPRYAMPLIPPFVCFVVYGLNEIIKIINTRLNRKSKEKSVIPIILIIVFIVSTFTYIAPLTIGDYGNDLVDVTDYIKEHDPDYSSKVIISEWHNYRTVKWYLNKNVTIVEDYYMDSLDSMKGDYVILQDKMSLDNYTRIFHSGRFYLYSHV